MDVAVHIETLIPAIYRLHIRDRRRSINVKLGTRMKCFRTWLIISDSVNFRIDNGGEFRHYSFYGRRYIPGGRYAVVTYKQTGSYMAIPVKSSLNFAHSKIRAQLVVGAILRNLIGVPALLNGRNYCD
ncbi:hypothetical protein V474_22845 [Novosphingobium barchaimii LL02]|uniref:Uncharacterized protein n=1 Tax=Novosphingobium barchaimii LL02 TaxID=1114963 RepID=A0A0J7XRE6_9SPHN|nr:hypothetical protein V474_22845 [Novosphingobium barchaimii LL02]